MSPSAPARLAVLALSLVSLPIEAKKPPARPAPAPPAAAPPANQSPAPSRPAAPPAAGTLRPNLYELRSGTLSVTYSTTGIDGKPHLHYKDAGTEEQFAGDQIRSQPTDAGEMVTVTTHRTVDSGGTTFSLFLPAVNLESAAEVASVNVVSITCVHRFSPNARWNRGQLDSSVPAVLNGTAKQVKF